MKEGMFKFGICIGLVLLGSASVRANSYRRYFFGDRAAISAGAGMATASNTDAIWYNPAGLGGNAHRQLQVSGTAYGLRVRKLNNVLSTELDGKRHSSDKAIHTFGIIPSALSFAFQWNERVSLGLGVFQIESEDINLRVAQQLPVSGSQDMWNQGMEYHEQSYQYAAGPALGVQLTNHLRWGIANFGVFRSVDASLRLYAGIDSWNENGQSDSFLLDSQYVQKKSAGTFFTSGVQWEISNRWNTGWVVRSPMIQFWEGFDSSRFDAITFDAITDNNLADEYDGVWFEYDEKKKSKEQHRMVDPMAVQWSLVYAHGRNWIGFDTEYQFPLKKKNHNGVWNANVGACISMSEKATLGMGFFTDNDSQRHFDGTLTKPGQRFGATTGIQLKTAELVSPLLKGSKSSAKRRRRVLETTLAFSYSLQEVEYIVVKALVDSHLPRENYAISFDRRRTMFHLFEVHFGGGFYF